MSSVKRKYKVGFIGTGIMARKHLSVITELSKKKLIPPIDIVGHLGSRIKPALNKFGKSFTNVEEFIKTTKPDLIYLCTPPFARVIYEKYLIENNISYFVEKPTLNTEALSIIKLLGGKTKKNLVIQTGFHWRYLKFNKTLKDLFDEDSIRLVIGYRFGSLPFQNWKLDKKLSGGSVYERLIHIVDLCKYLLKGNFKIIQYTNNKSTLNKTIEPDCNIPDAEILIFKIGEVLCNVSSATYSNFNNLLELRFIGQNNIYNICLNNNGSVELQLIHNNHITKKYSENSEKLYKKENIYFWKSVINKDRNSIQNYKKDVELGLLLYNSVYNQKRQNYVK